MGLSVRNGRLRDLTLLLQLLSVQDASWHRRCYHQIKPSDMNTLGLLFLYKFCHTHPHITQDQCYYTCVYTLLSLPCFFQGRAPIFLCLLCLQLAGNNVEILDYKSSHVV